MGEILVGGVLFVLTVLGLLVWSWAIERGNGGPRLSERRLNANHLGLYLLVNDLVALQDRGYQPVFPDKETLENARGLLADCQRLITDSSLQLGSTSEFE